jgi:hypothetical protein
MDTDDDSPPPRTDDRSVTPEQRARELLDRMDVPGALDMTAGDVVELANLIAERDHLMRLRDAAADADEDMADHPPPGLAGGPPIDLKADTFKMPLFTSITKEP